MGCMFAVLGTTARAFRGLLAAVHPAIIVAIGAAAIFMPFMAALMILPVLGRTLAMLAMILALRRLVLRVVLTVRRRCLRCSGSGDPQRDRHGYDFHVAFLWIRRRRDRNLQESRGGGGSASRLMPVKTKSGLGDGTIT